MSAPKHCITHAGLRTTEHHLARLPCYFIFPLRPSTPILHSYTCFCDMLQDTFLGQVRMSSIHKYRRRHLLTCSRWQRIAVAWHPPVNNFRVLSVANSTDGSKVLCFMFGGNVGRNPSFSAHTAHIERNTKHTFGDTLWAATHLYAHSRPCLPMYLMLQSQKFRCAFVVLEE